MDKATARRLADALTWSRIWSVIPLTMLAWYEQRWWFLGLYIAAALTDLADGYFGRRAAPPKSDADLDGNADVLFSVLTLLWIWMLIPGFYEKYWLPYLPILFLIQVYLWYAMIKWPGLHSPHFQFGRFGMMVFCFLLPVLIVFGDQPWFVHTVFVIGTIGKLQVAWHFTSSDKTGLARANHA
jgi:phosphatidylglycerophosphate synthase